MFTALRQPLTPAERRQRREWAARAERGRRRKDPPVIQTLGDAQRAVEGNHFGSLRLALTQRPWPAEDLLELLRKHPERLAKLSSVVAEAARRLAPEERTRVIDEGLMLAAHARCRRAVRAMVGPLPILQNPPSPAPITHEGWFDWLMEQGFRPTPDRASRWLVQHAERGGESLLLTLLGQGASVTGRDPNRLTVLMLAVKNHGVKTIETLLRLGCDVNETTSCPSHPGWSALHFAAERAINQRLHGQPIELDEVQQLLTRFGGDWFRSSSSGVTPLDLFYKTNPGGSPTSLIFRLGERLSSSQPKPNRRL